MLGTTSLATAGLTAALDTIVFVDAAAAALAVVVIVAVAVDACKVRGVQGIRRVGGRRPLHLDASGSGGGSVVRVISVGDRRRGRQRAFLAHAERPQKPRAGFP